MLLPPLPTGNSRNKIEFLYELMNSGEPSSDAPFAIPIIQGDFYRSGRDGWNEDLDGFLLTYSVSEFSEFGDMDILPLISLAPESDEPFVKFFFNLSTMLRLSNFEGELGFAVVLADEQGNVIKSPDGYVTKLDLKSTTVHGTPSELGQRVTANETAVLWVDKELIKGKEKVILHLMIRGDAAYTSDSGRTDKEILSRVFLHGGDVTLVGLGVS
ncbi:hypothetical protein AB6D63_17600 [Vibrio splendidus]